MKLGVGKKNMQVQCFTALFAWKMFRNGAISYYIDCNLMSFMHTDSVMYPSIRSSLL